MKLYSTHVFNKSDKLSYFENFWNKTQYLTKQLFQTNLQYNFNLVLTIKVL